MKKHLFLFAACVAAVLGAGTAQAAPFTDTFDSISGAWVKDRYNPAAFESVSFQGDNRLRIGISTNDSAQNRPAGFSSLFYNTQGKQRPGGIGAPWTLSADLWIGSDWNDTLKRSDLWGRDSNVEANAHYPIIGFTNSNAADPFNPAAAKDPRFRVWDGNTPNGWVDLGLPPGFSYDEWYNLAIYSDGTSFEYYIDGQLVYTDLTGSAAGFGGLQTVFLEAYNFGFPPYPGADYSVYWDNLNAQEGFAVVPEPASIVVFGLAGLAVAGGVWRRIKRQR